MVWLALVFMLVAVLGSLAWAASRGWRLYRALRRTTGRLGDAAARLAEKGAATEQRALAVGGDSEKLTQALARLQRTLAAFAVIRTAAAEPRALIASIRSGVPRK